MHWFFEPLPQGTNMVFAFASLFAPPIIAIICVAWQDCRKSSSV